MGIPAGRCLGFSPNEKALILIRKGKDRKSAMIVIFYHSFFCLFVLYTTGCPVIEMSFLCILLFRAMMDGWILVL